jgi:hypothetical protein
MLKGKNQKHFLKFRNETRISIPFMFIQYRIQFMAIGIMQEKEIYLIQTGKQGVKISLENS